MKKLIVATMMAGIAGFAQAEELGGQNWRVSAGGFARGSMKAKIGSMSDTAELYGADMDISYRIIRKGDFSLWAGIGGTFAPYQEVHSMSFDVVDASDPYTTLELGGKGDLEVGCGEFRMLLVPEYDLTERWSFGARIGVAFDWLRARGSLSTWSRTTINIPGIPSTVIPVGSTGDTEKFSDFTAQGIIGLQTTYLITDNLGFYAALDYRAGGDADFEKNGEKYGSLDMDGWYVSAGVMLQF